MRDTPGCIHCLGGPEPGWIEAYDNGPIVPCPSCNELAEKDRAWEAALAQRAMQGKSS